MTKAMMLFILAICLMVYHILIHLVDRKYYIAKASAIQKVLELLINNPNMFDNKDWSWKLIYKIEEDLRDL